MKRFMSVILAAILGSAITIGTNMYFEEGDAHEISYKNNHEMTAQHVANKIDGSMVLPAFTNASEKAVEAVVHVKSLNVVSKTVYNYKKYNDPFSFFFGGPNHYYREPQRKDEVHQSSGSGVIVSSNGYIVTNNHVVDGADKLEVVLDDNRSFEAKVVGTDPSTDIAVLKIDAKDLNYLNFANSDEINIGDWVLAVGNPFNLSSTVTAGIVSAKARNINILQDKAAIESFIQTDAAVNPGNSGGALVNLNGNLIGINTAIATPTGTFAGYSFAVPSNIVGKVIDDLIKDGQVNRAYLGVNIRELDSKLAKELNIDYKKGIYVDYVMPGSPADVAGLKTSDIIVKVNNINVFKSPELLEQIGQHSPGDVLDFTVYRDGNEKSIPVTLKNISNKENLIKNEMNEIEKMLGADFEDINKDAKKRFRINNGVVVKDITRGKIKDNTNMQAGFVVTKINKQPIESLEDVYNIVKKSERMILFEGIYPGYYGKYQYKIIM